MLSFISKSIARKIVMGVLVVIALSYGALILQQMRLIGNLQSMMNDFASGALAKKGDLLVAQMNGGFKWNKAVQIDASYEEIKEDKASRLSSLVAIDMDEGILSRFESEVFAPYDVEEFYNRVKASDNFDPRAVYTEIDGMNVVSIAPSIDTKKDEVLGYLVTAWALDDEMVVVMDESLVTATIISIAAAFVNLAILVVLIQKVVVSPLVKTSEEMNALAKGSHTVEISNADRLDQIGSMAKALAVFKDNMQKMQKMQAEQEELKEAAEREKRISMNNMADDFDARTAQAIASLSAAAEKMNGTAVSMNSALSQTTGLAQSVAASAEEADANVQTVAAATEELSASSQEISKQISQVAGMASTASKEAEATSAAVNKLESMADSIGEVVGAISDIAEQTNLLALNATIEAARAGEAGKGFAVVADEVKKLANETGQKTEQIGERVASIQGAIANSVAAMDKIISNVQKINEAAASVSGAVEEQNAATAEIGRNVSEASGGTQQVSSNITSVRETVEQTASSSQVVLEASDELKELADNLEREVKVFLDEIRMDDSDENKIIRVDAEDEGFQIAADQGVDEAISDEDGTDEVKVAAE